MKTVRIQRIYEEVLVEMNLPEEYYDSKLRLLRMRGKFLLEQVMGRDVNSLKNSGKIEVPEKEAPIIKNILQESLDPESMVCDWFAGKIDISDPQRVTLLYWQLKEPIMRPMMQGKTDEVTTDEWLASLDSAIDFSNSQKVIKMKRLLDELRLEALPLDAHIGAGDIIAEDENGNRRYAMRGRRKNPVVLQILGKLLDELNTEDDYIEALNYLLSHFVADARKKAEDVVTALAQYYSLCDSLVEDEPTEEGEEMLVDEYIASEYVQRDRKVFRYLQKKPEFAQRLSAKFGVDDVSAYFGSSEEEH